MIWLDKMRAGDGLVRPRLGPGMLSKIIASGNSLLKWRAQLESKLKSCVIFRAKYLRKSSQNPKDDKKLTNKSIQNDFMFYFCALCTIKMRMGKMKEYGFAAIFLA